MRSDLPNRPLLLAAGLIAAIAAVGLGGCDRLEPNHSTPGSDGAPSAQELQKIQYMSTSNTGPNGRKFFDHPEQARSCKDFELAMRWNRPPNLASGAFNKKMVYLTLSFPPDLPKESEVFLSGRIERGEALPARAQWYVKLSDGTRVQAVETANFWEKEEAAAQDARKGDPVAIVNPEKPGRALCAHGVYQGLLGKDAQSDRKLPLVSVLFAMDRDR